MAVLGIALAYNIFCVLVVAQFRKNVCEQMQGGNRFMANQHYQPSPSAIEDPTPSAPQPPSSPPPTYDEATNQAPSETVKINIYSDDPDSAKCEAAAELPPDYSDAIKLPQTGRK